MLEDLDYIDHDAERDGVPVVVRGLDAALAGLKTDAAFHHVATVKKRAEYAHLIPVFDKPKAEGKVDDATKSCPACCCFQWQTAAISFPLPS